MIGKYRYNITMEKHLKSSFSLVFIALAMLFASLGIRAAQRFPVPPENIGRSVRAVGLMYCMCGDEIEKAKNVDNSVAIVDEISRRFEIRPFIELDDSDRSYITECMIYCVEKMARTVFIQNGDNLDDPDIALKFQQVMDENTENLKREMAGANTIGDAFEAFNKAFE